MDPSPPFNPFSSHSDAQLSGNESPSAHDLSASPLSSNKGPYFKYSRARARKACLTCNKRKVRCDVTTKDYPREKCTNCFEFNIECVVPARKKREKRATSSNGDNSVTNEDYENKNISEPVKMVADNETIPRHFSTADTRQLRRLQKENTPFHSSPPDSIQLDPERIGNRSLDRSKMAQLYHALSPFHITEVVVDDFWNDRSSNEIADKGRLDSVTMEMLKAGGAFELPDQDTCMAYINAYFIHYHPRFPFISKAKFLAEYRDLRDPPSLLMLRSVLFIGCRCFYKNNVDQEYDQMKLLYRRAKMLFDAEVETRPIPLTASLLLLGSISYSDLSFKTAESYLSTAIEVCTLFSMHKDQTNNPLLSDDEKKSYKRIFWSLFARDRTFALSFSKNLSIDLTTCTVKALTEEDLDHDAYPDTQEKEGMKQFFFSFIRLGELIGEITEQQKKANTLAAKGLPYSSIVHHIKYISDSYFNSISPVLQGNHSSSWIIQIYFYQVSLIVHQTNLGRLSSLLTHMVQTRNYTKLSAVLDYDFDPNSEFKNCFEKAHKTCKLVEPIMRNGNFLLFTENIVYAVYHSVISLIPYLFHMDPNISRIARDDIDMFIALTNEHTHFKSNSSSWPMIEVSQYILDTIYPDEEKLVIFVRKVLKSEIFELMANKWEEYGIEAVLANLVFVFRPPFREPIFSIAERPISATAATNSMPHLNSQQYSLLPDGLYSPALAIQIGNNQQLEHFNSHSTFSRFLPSIKAHQGFDVQEFQQDMQFQQQPTNNNNNNNRNSNNNNNDNDSTTTANHLQDFQSTAMSSTWLPWPVNDAKTHSVAGPEKSASIGYQQYESRTSSNVLPILQQYHSQNAPQ